MSATKEGEDLEKGYNSFTDNFTTIMALNFGAAFLKFYNPNSPLLALGAAWGLHQKFEGQYQDVSKMFYGSFRKAETGLFNMVPYADKKTNYGQFATNFMIHGPQAIQRKEALLERPWTDFTAFEKSQSVNGLTQELVNKALEAPRANIMQTMEEDPEVTRWIRKSDSSACKFCKMLVSRGAVYIKSTASFRSHGNCGCSAVPVYDGYKIPDDALQAAKEWAGENKGNENQRRKTKNNMYAVEQGLKEKKTETYIDKNGHEATRSVYVDTEKGKQAKREDSKKALENLEKLKRDGAAYRKPKMTNRQHVESAEEILRVKKVLQAKRLAELDALLAGDLEGDL